MSSNNFGICSTCVFQSLVHTTRGSTFSLCERSREDSRYPRYPRVPVNACSGYSKGRRSDGTEQPAKRAVPEDDPLAGER